jgi:hypothetical protein
MTIAIDLNEVPNWVWVISAILLCYMISGLIIRFDSDANDSMEKKCLFWVFYPFLLCLLPVAGLFLVLKYVFWIVAYVLSLGVIKAWQIKVESDK